MTFAELNIGVLTMILFGIVWMHFWIYVLFTSIQVTLPSELIFCTLRPIFDPPNGHFVLRSGIFLSE